MRCNKSLTVLSVAVVLCALGVASASAGSDRDEVRGIKIGPQGQVFGNPSYAAGEARAQARALAKPERGSAHARAAAAYGAAAGPPVMFDPLSMQHKDPGWEHNYQSSCDVDPNCNGWAKAMHDYEQRMQEYKQSQQ